MTTEREPTIQWEGKSGKKYTYWITPIAGFNGKAEGGNYVFAKESRPGWWVPIYIGQTGDLSERFDTHHKITCIRANGATHIHTHTQSVEAMRLNEEGDLLAKWMPPCNG